MISREPVGSSKGQLQLGTLMCPILTRRSDRRWIIRFSAANCGNLSLVICCSPAELVAPIADRSVGSGDSAASAAAAGEMSTTN